MFKKSLFVVWKRIYGEKGRKRPSGNRETSISLAQKNDVCVSSHLPRRVTKAGIDVTELCYRKGEDETGMVRLGGGIPTLPCILITFY